MSEFREKNYQNFGDDLTNQIQLSDLFRNGFLQSQQRLGMNLLGQNDYSNLFSNINQNPYLNAPAFESLKNLSRSFGNFNFAINNVNNYINDSQPSQLGNVNQAKSETSSMSVKSSSEKMIKPKKIAAVTKVPHRIFNSTNSISNSGNLLRPEPKDLLAKIRRRSIKNNKIVFVHSASAAAKKIAQEKVVCLL